MSSWNLFYILMYCNALQCTALREFLWKTIHRKSHYFQIIRVISFLLIKHEIKPQLQMKWLLLKMCYFAMLCFVFIHLWSLFYGLYNGIELNGFAVLSIIFYYNHLYYYVIWINFRKCIFNRSFFVDFRIEKFL